MPPTALSAAITRLSAPLQPCPSDGVLVASFAADRNEVAFAELVRRYGPMVLGVCRRITGHAQDAEDAFQGTFLVLARRAGAVGRPEQIDNWLYGVAVRTARATRAAAARRRIREAPTDPLPEVSCPEYEPLPEELHAILDEELVRLPEKYRSLIVSCDLRGEPQAVAARRLGLPVGTVYTRVAKARKMLASRLEARGVALSVACLTIASGEAASATVLSHLTVRTITTAINPDLAPAHLVATANGVLRLMLMHKLRSVSLALGLGATMIFCGLLLAGDPPTRSNESRPLIAFADPPKPGSPPDTKIAEARPLPRGPNKLLFYRAGQLTLIDPNGKNARDLRLNGGKFPPGHAELSPDGKRLAWLITADSDLLPINGRIRRKLHVRNLTSTEPATDLEVEGQMFCWSGKGSEIAYCDYVEEPEKMTDVTLGIVNVITKAKSPLKLPEGHILQGWSADGKCFLTSLRSLDQNDSMVDRLYLVDRDGTGVKALTAPDQHVVIGRLSPNDKQVLYSSMTYNSKDKPVPHSGELKILNIISGKVTPVADIPLNAYIRAISWSPDGKQIAYAWQEIHEGIREDVDIKETTSTLIVCDLDGKNQKMIGSEKGRKFEITIDSISWR